MGLELAAADIAAPDDRTDGRIAGLQLAALSMQGHRDAAGFIRGFAGDHCYIMDNLVDEVLERQPDCARDFLLQTAILDRLNGPLCNAVTGEEDGTARLDAPEGLLQAADQGERMGSVIEVLVLQALAHQVHGDIPAALVPLSRAMALCLSTLCTNSQH